MMIQIDAENWYSMWFHAILEDTWFWQKSIHVQPVLVQAARGRPGIIRGGEYLLKVLRDDLIL